jgi:hypothetical protein
MRGVKAIIFDNRFLALLILAALVLTVFSSRTIYADVVRTQNVTGNFPLTATSASLSISAPASGSLIVAALSVDKSAGTITVPTGFTLIHDHADSSTSGALAYKISDGTETSTVWSWTNSRKSAAWVGVYTGLTVTPFDVSAEANSNNVNTAAQTTGTTGTTAQANEFAIAIATVDSGDNGFNGRAWSNGFTEAAFTQFTIVDPGLSSGDPGLFIAEKTLSSIGTVETTYSVVDGDGNTGDQMWAAVATFRIADTTKPVITLTGSASVSVNAGATYTDAGATASDNIDGDISDDIVVTNPVNTAVPAVYTVRYNVSDAAGNAATEVTRTVTVTDVAIPVITLNGSSAVTIQYGEVYADAGATATDDVDGDITADIVAVNPVNTSVAGTYTVTYNVSDNAGNAATEVTRTVVVNQPSTFRTSRSNQSVVVPPSSVPSIQTNNQATTTVVTVTETPIHTAQPQPKSVPKINNIKVENPKPTGQTVGEKIDSEIPVEFIPPIPAPREIVVPTEVSENADTNSIWHKVLLLTLPGADSVYFIFKLIMKVI